MSLCVVSFFASVITLRVIMLNVIKFNVIMQNVMYAEYRDTEFCYGECHYAERIGELVHSVIDAVCHIC